MGAVRDRAGQRPLVALVDFAYFP